MLWGIGPNSYQNFDLIHKTLHNDILAFTVERGIIGTSGLIFLGLLSVATAFRLFQLHVQRPSQVRIGVIIYLAAIVAVMVDSQFHQVFHERALWLVVAVQEATLVRLSQKDHSNAS